MATLAQVKRAATGLDCEVEADTVGDSYEVEITSPDGQRFRASDAHSLVASCWRWFPKDKVALHASLLADLDEGCEPCDCGDC